MAGKTAKQAMGELMEGNMRFVNGNMEYPNQGRDRREALLKGQKPFAAVLCCSDSRVVPEIIFDQGLGDIFTIRIAGNICDSHGLASVEYAVHHLDVDLVLVLGHTGCGAVTAVANEDEIKGKMSRLKGRIRRACIKTRDEPGNKVLNAIIKNVELEVVRLIQTGPFISKAVMVGDTEIIGAIYNMETGKVELLLD